MKLGEDAQRLREELENRGLGFTKFIGPDALEILHPAGWRATLEEDHIAIHHGEPSQGQLSIFPVVQESRISDMELMAAFLDEFVEASGERYELLELNRHPVHPELRRARFRLVRGKERLMGLALAWVGHRQARALSYWTHEELFRAELIDSLLVLTLGSMKAPKGSRFADGAPRVAPVAQGALWQKTDLEVSIPFGPRDGRFALKLPEGWTGIEVGYEGENGWLLVPPGLEAGAPNCPLISVSSADQCGAVEDMVGGALERLTEGGAYQVESAPFSVKTARHEGMVQLWRGYPPDSPGECARLWSLGLGDGDTVVHLIAVARADLLPEFFEALNAIGHSLQVLPRKLDLKKMRQMAGGWRFRQAEPGGEDVLEVKVTLNPDGNFLREEQLVEESGPPRAREEGRWDVAYSHIRFCYMDGSRESLHLEEVNAGGAIVEKVLWLHIPAQ